MIQITSELQDLMTKKSFFNKLAGTDTLFNQIESGMNEEEIRKSWQQGLNEFEKIRSYENVRWAMGSCGVYKN